MLNKPPHTNRSSNNPSKMNKREEDKNDLKLPAKTIEDTDPDWK